MIEIKAPNTYKSYTKDRTLFLSGSIDQGKAVKWQDEIVESLKGIEDLIILNPRRDDWDDTWNQSIDDPKFKEQVEWELTGIINAEITCVVFDPQGKAPITLLELGIMAARQWNTDDKRKIIVYCPEGYWRKGNVDIICDWSDFTVVNSLEQVKEEIKKDLQERRY